MNFTACIKSARIKPNYVLNVSIDIPLKSGKILSDRSHVGEVTFSPNRIHLNKKMKLSMPTSSVPKTTRDADSRKISSCLGQTQNTISHGNKKKTFQTINSYHKKHKNKSCQVSPKRKFKPQIKEKRKKSSVSNKMLCRFANDSEDNIINYNTNQSTEVKRDLLKKKQPSNEPIEDVNIMEIRQYEKIATQRKQHLNYLYLKEKVLVLASVKKIQRAWRNYRTKKLLRSYSNNISIKFTNKMKHQLPNENILTVRSLGGEFKKHKRQLKESDELFFIEEKNQKKEKQKKASREESLKEFQKEQIKKWEELIDQIRMGKKVEDVLENSFKRKIQLEKDLEKYQNEDKQSWQNSVESENVKKDQGMTTQERRKKLQFFQSQIRKIDNQNSDINSISQFDYFQANRNINRVNEEIENQKLKKKLQLFNQLQLLEDNQEEIEKKLKNHSQSNSSSGDLSSDKLQTHRIISVEEEVKNQMSKKLVSEKKLKQFKKLSQKENFQFIGLFVEELILQFFLEISQSDKLVQKMKDLYDRITKEKNNKNSQKKPQGICTNLQSIKDYLENLVAYIFQQHPTLLSQRLMVSCGPTPLTLFKYIRNQPTPQSTDALILSESLFEEHWSYASEQIYFDAKYQDEEDQRERVKYLKNLTRIYFRAIYDAFNECLQPFRLYGLAGKPYPWKNPPLNIKNPQPRKVVRGAYKRLSSMAMVFCGILLEDKKHIMSEEVMKEIQNQRMNTLLEMEMSNQEHRWTAFDDEEAEVLVMVADMVVGELVDEMGDKLGSNF